VLKRAGRLVSAHGLDGADEGTALGDEVVGRIGDGRLKIPATRFGSGGGLGDRPADHNLGNLAKHHTSPYLCNDVTPANQSH
jgi:hypothetical protein